MKKHLKYIDGSSDKFWQIEVLENTYTVAYGRNGTGGTSQSKTFADSAECLKAAEKLLNEKIKKGYSETGEVTIPIQAAKTKSNPKSNTQEILDAYDAVIKSRDIRNLLPFLEENAKGNIELLKKHIKKQKQYWMSFIDLTKEPQFKRDNYQWGTRGDDRQKDIVTLSAIAIYSKSDIASWAEAFNVLNQAKVPQILEVLHWAKPTWLADFLLERMKRDQWQNFDYTVLRFLEDEGLIAYQPELFARCLSAFVEWRSKMKTRDFIAFIVSDEKAYAREVLELFNYETGIQNQYFRDNDKQVYNEFYTWEVIFNQLLDEHKIDRKLFIEQSILIQTKEWNNNLKSFFRKRMADINPTAEELVLFQELIFAGLQHANPHIVNASSDLVKKIYDDKKFNVSSFLDWLEPLMLSKDNKTAIKSLLPVLEKLNKSHPKFNKKITALLADVFVVPDLNLQERAVKLILKIANKKDQNLKEKLSGYSSLMLGNVRNSLTDFLAEEASLVLEEETAGYEYAATQEMLLTEPVALPQNWNDVLFLFGKFIASNEVIDTELLLNTYITQRHLFPNDYNKQLQPYAKQLEKKYFGSLHKAYASVFFEQKISQIDNVFGVKVNQYHKIKTLLLIRPYLYAVQNKMATKSVLPMLSFPTHYPYWVAPKVLMERLIAYQNSGETIDKLDLSIAIGRMPREQTEEAIALLEQLNGELKELMAFCLGQTKTISIKPGNVFNRLLSKLSASAGSHLINAWVVAARTHYPEDIFPEFSTTAVKDYPFAVAPFRPKFRINEKWNEYVNYQTKQKERTPSWYELDFDTSGYYTVPNEFLYALDHYGRKGGWEYMMGSEGDVNYWHSLMPQNADALSCFLLRGACLHASNGGESLKGFLHLINGKGFRFSPLSMLVFACTFFNDKKEVRLTAAEVLINLVEKKAVNTSLLAAALAFLATNKYGPFSRLIESIEMLKDVSPQHNSAFFVSIEDILKELHVEKLPVNFKKLVEHYVDLLHKTKQKPSPAALAFFEKWQDSSSLKGLIKQILN